MSSHEVFCEHCGDCEACYEDDPCALSESGLHSFLAPKQDISVKLARPDVPPELRAQVLELALRAVEWIQIVAGAPQFCPSCNQMERRGHAKHCLTASALRGRL